MAASSQEAGTKASAIVLGSTCPFLWLMVGGVSRDRNWTMGCILTHP